ncbi:unnamed protein product, partial [Phaeothamnion confervicola]
AAQRFPLVTGVTVRKASSSPHERFSCSNNYAMQNAAAVPPGATGTANRVVDAFTSNPRRFHRHRDPGGPGESHAACHAMRYLLSSIHPVRDPRNLSPPRSGYSYSRPRPDRRPHTVGAIPSQGRSRYSPPSTAPAGSLATRPATTSLTWGLDSLPSASGGGGRGAHSGGEHVGGGGGDLFPAGPLREGEEDPQHDGNNGFPGTLSKRFGSAAAMATAAATAAVAAPSHGCGLTELQSGATASAWGRGGPDCWARANFLLRR